MGFFVSFGAAFPARIPRPAVLGPGGCSKNPPYPCPRKEKSAFRFYAEIHRFLTQTGYSRPARKAARRILAASPGRKGKTQ